jgi:hypothetical protein
MDDEDSMMDDTEKILDDEDDGINRDGQDRQDHSILDFRLESSTLLSELCFYPVHLVCPCLIPTLISKNQGGGRDGE